MCPRQDFGPLLRSRRVAAKLSQAELARRARVSRATISNLEEGRTEPAGDTRQRLAQVAALGLDKEIAEHAEPAQWMASQYNPLDMSRNMERVLNGPGGTLEQTYAYLDPSSATDWYDNANQPAYIERFRDAFPAEEIASVALEGHTDRRLDLIALGVGDGRCEARLAQRLAERGDLRAYLLDISHPLLVEGWKRVAAALPGVPVFPIHGNFLDLRSAIALSHRTDDRRRCWTMIGNTFGNLDYEPRFLADLAACSRRGDLLLLDVDLAWAPADDVAAIRAADPALCNDLPQHAVRWLTGLLWRHCRGAQRVRLEVEMSTRCPLPGSYQLSFIGHVVLPGEQAVRHQLFLARRYTLVRLAAELGDLGWKPLQSTTYGPNRQKGCLLLERV